MKLVKTYPAAGVAVKVTKVPKVYQPPPATVPADALALALTGIGIGLANSIALTRVMAAMLYETSTTDPIILGSSAVLFLVVALLASYLPARRATKIDPMEALQT